MPAWNLPLYVSVSKGMGPCSEWSHRRLTGTEDPTAIWATAMTLYLQDRLL